MPRQNVPPRKTALYLIVGIREAVNTFQVLSIYTGRDDMSTQDVPNKKKKIIANSKEFKSCQYYSGLKHTQGLGKMFTPRRKGL